MPSVAYDEVQMQHFKVQRIMAAPLVCPALAGRPGSYCNPADSVCSLFMEFVMKDGYIKRVKINVIKPLNDIT